jgi:hypothetical protein
MAVSKSIRLYGHSNPPIAFSDDPMKVGNVLPSYDTISTT